MTDKRTPPKRGPLHWLGCLLQIPLGCFAFLLGGGIVLIAFLPFALGSLLARWGVESFSVAHIGSLEIEDAWLGSLYGDQGIKGVVLRDGDGVEVLRGSLEAPSFWSLLFGSGSEWGPIRLHLDRLDLRRQGDRWRLLDAFGSEPVTPETTARRETSATVDLGSDPDALRKAILLEVRVDRLLATDGEGRDFELEGLEGRGTIRLEVPTAAGETARNRALLRFDGSGQARVAGPETRALGLAWSLEAGEGQVTWQVSVDAERIETRLFGALFPGFTARPEIAPTDLDSLHLRLGQAHSGAPLDLSLGARAPGESLELAGRWDVLEGRLESGPSGSLRLTANLGGARARHLLSALLPFLAFESLSPSDGEGSLRLTLTDFVIDPGAAQPVRRAEGRLETGLASLAVESVARRALALRATTRLVGPCEFRIGAKGVSYTALRYDGENGPVEVSGTCPLGGLPTGLLVRLPSGGSFEVLAGPKGPRLTPAR